MKSEETSQSLHPAPNSSGSSSIGHMQEKGSTSKIENTKQMPTSKTASSAPIPASYHAEAAQLMPHNMNNQKSDQLGKRQNSDIVMDKHDVESPKSTQQTISMTLTTADKPTSATISDIERVDMEYVDKCISILARLEQPIIQLSGVGPKTELAFHKLGVYTLRDLLWHFPRSFIDRSKLYTSIHDIANGEIGTFRLKINRDKVRSNTVTCTDEAGKDVDVIYFYGRNRQSMAMVSNAMTKLSKEDVMIVSGKVKHNDQKAELFNPDFVVTPDQVDKLGIEPVYALSAGLTKNKLIAAIDQALGVADELLSIIPESLPDDALQKLNWPKLKDALVTAHKPKSMEETGLDSTARRRLAFEEMTIQQAQLALTRWKLKQFGLNTAAQQSNNAQSWKESPLVSAAVSALPFNLTASQDKCINEMWDDAILGESRMLRLLQGKNSSAFRPIVVMLY